MSLNTDEFLKALEDSYKALQSEDPALPKLGSIEHAEYGPKALQALGYLTLEPVEHFIFKFPVVDRAVAWDCSVVKGALKTPGIAAVYVRECARSVKAFLARGPESRP